MAADPVVVYIDDPDASWTFTITSRDGTQIDWTTPTIAIGSGDYTVTGTWETSAGTTRTVRVPLSGLTRGTKQLYLQVPGGTDIHLGAVAVTLR